MLRSHGDRHRRPGADVLVRPVLTVGFCQLAMTWPRPDPTPRREPGAIREQIAGACERVGPRPRRRPHRGRGQDRRAARRSIGCVEAGVRRGRGELRAGAPCQSRSGATGSSWHYIGTLQSRLGAPRGRRSPTSSRPSPRAGDANGSHGRAAGDGPSILDVLIEVDFTGERTGVAPERARPPRPTWSPDSRASACVGLMTLPPITVRRRGCPAVVPCGSESSGMESREHHPDAVELSMGMSLDYQVAVEEGATMVRIGTALFGPRAQRAPGNDR